LTIVAICRIIVGRLPVIPLLKRLEEILDAERLRSERDLVRLIEAGLSTKVVQGLRTLGLTDGEIYQGVLPRRTLTHRMARREPLNREESDRVVRIARIVAFGERIFGERERFWRWFRAPKRQFDGRSPLAMLATEAGARLVEEDLGAIDHGFVA
jgi:putative toxin-antitoxin system antitoxin component (TIGR02293 family)